MKKIIALFCSVIIISLLLSACRSPSAYFWCPNVQPNTKWISEDGMIEFTVSDVEYVGFGDMIGTLTVDDQTVEFVVDFAIDNIMYLHPMSMIENENEFSYYERWESSHRAKRFTVTVLETTFFEVGQEIVFYRVDE